MATFEITGPDGHKYRVTAPEGATEAEIMARVKAQVTAGAATSHPQARPIASQSEYAPIPGPMNTFGQQPQPNPATDPAGFLNQGVQQVGGDVQQFGQNIDNMARATASGATFGLADEFAAGMNTMTGLGQGENYTQNLEAERATDASIPLSQRLAGELLGMGMTGGLASGAGLTMMNMARPTVGGMALRGAGEGAAYGGLYGFGSGEGQEDRLQRAAFGGLTGAAAGGLAGGLAGALSRRPQVPTADELKAQANAAYQAVDNSGLMISGGSVQNFGKQLEATLANEGIDTTLHPRVVAALTRIVNSQDDISFQGMDILRRVAKNAAASTDPSERRLAQIVIENIDDFVRNLQPADIVGGTDPATTVQTLRLAREMWSRGSKSEFVQNLVQRAQDSMSNYTQSGFENALRREFRSIIRNPSKMRLFTTEEQAALRAVAQGGPIANVLRWIGKLAPRGPISAAISGGGGYAVGGPLGAVAAPTLGEAAKFGATRATMGAVNNAQNMMAAGGPVYRQPLSIADLLLARTTGQLGGLLGSTIPKRDQ